MELKVIIMEFKLTEQDGNLFLSIPELTELGLLNVMTTKSMDVGTYTNGNESSIIDNFEDAYRFLGKKPEILYNGYQVHSANLELIKDLSQGLKTPYGRYIPSTDGLLTSKKGIALLTRFADCVPIILYDAKLGVHANIHSGWKGTLLGIGVKALKAMVTEYGSDPLDVIAILGPSIDRDDFEVEYDVASMFEREYGHIDGSIRRKNGEKYLVDLQGIIKYLLKEAGISDENLYTVPISTFSDHRFHSYRRDKENYGLMGFITMLK